MSKTNYFSLYYDEIEYIKERQMSFTKYRAFLRVAYHKEFQRRLRNNFIAHNRREPHDADLRINGVCNSSLVLSEV